MTIAQEYANKRVRDNSNDTVGFVKRLLPFKTQILNFCDSGNLKNLPVPKEFIRAFHSFIYQELLNGKSHDPEVSMYDFYMTKNSKEERLALISKLT